MKNFNYYAPTQVVFGRNTERRFHSCRGYEFTLPATAGLRIFASIIMLTNINTMNKTLLISSMLMFVAIVATLLQRYNN